MGFTAMMRSPSTIAVDEPAGARRRDPRDSPAVARVRCRRCCLRGRPVLCEHRGHLRMRFDAQQRFVKRRTRLLQMRPRSRPFRHDGGEQIERADRRRRRDTGGPERDRRTSPSNGAGAPACPRGCASCIASSASAAPALGIIDDADRGVAVRRDEHQPADRLRTRRVVAGQEAAVADARCRGG